MYNQALRKAQVGGLASNPANGINNIMLQGGQDQQIMPQQNMMNQQPNMMNQQPNMMGANANPAAIGNQIAGAGTGVDANEVLTELKKLLNFSPEQIKQSGSKIMELAHQASSEQYKKDLEIVANLCEHNSDPAKQTIDPDTGSKEPLAQDKIKEIIQRIESDMEDKKPAESKPNTVSTNVFNFSKYAAKKPARDEDDTRKKKTRGNPFRVLMGQVGKLLDHGMSKRDIIKYLLRKGYWNEETIGRAVNIVKDYNRDKHTAPAKGASVSNFNLIRQAEKTEDDKDFNIKPDWAKRSTTELFARAAWLKSAQAFNDSMQNDGRKAADLSGVSSELKAIRSALKNRGFAEEELP